MQDGNDEYSLLVNLKRLYELQLLKPVLVESMYDEIALTLRNFRNLDEEVLKDLCLELLLSVLFLSHLNVTVAHVCLGYLFHASEYAFVYGMVSALHHKL